MSKFKLSTKKAVKKRFFMNGKGAFTRGAACRRHGLRRRDKDSHREGRRNVRASSSHKRLLNTVAPYGV